MKQKWISKRWFAGMIAMVLGSMVMLHMPFPSSLGEAVLSEAKAHETENTSPAKPTIDTTIKEVDADQVQAIENANFVPAMKSSPAFTSTAKPKTMKAVKKAKSDKVVYLTFDDGPSPLTDQVLEILQQEKVKATFFVLGEQAKRSPEMITRIVDGGHALGNHTYDHKYDVLYASFGHFWKQIKATEEVLREITGTRTPLVRAPGGTYGHFDHTYFDLLEQGGYQVFDWNVDSGDSKRKGVPAAEIVSNVKGSRLQDTMVVLLHDGKGHKESVKALPEIIRFYKQQGYVFRTLSTEQPPVQFTVSPAMKNKSRPQPSKDWVAANVAPNSALFGPALPLKVEAGGVQTRLAPGEYQLVKQQYWVPVRSAMEQLGAEVRWNENNQSAIINWGDASVTLDAKKGVLTNERNGAAFITKIAGVKRKNDALWIPLRPLLQALGHPVIQASSTVDEHWVKAL
ncbi:polysaccharide deacetylase [Paenibacillus sanguinis]|uniref:polysaccharide deacetylase n=1 Tax=Paenibacillus sanguinis TaxID=225906 RepID=UPI000360BF8B|nr:polysaccharide deacetylase [Paenibacillus sanguinis]